VFQARRPARIAGISVESVRDAARMLVVEHSLAADPDARLASSGSNLRRRGLGLWRPSRSRERLSSLEFEDRGRDDALA
jgi:hypothetical protein